MNKELLAHLQKNFGADIVEEFRKAESDAHEFWRQKAIKLAEARYTPDNRRTAFETGFLSAFEFLSELYPSIKIRSAEDQSFEDCALTGGGTAAPIGIFEVKP